VTTAVVTDSTSDIPLKMLQEEGIFQIPADLTLGDQTYQDGFDLSRNDFYRMLPQLKKLPTTAAPSTGRFESLYREIFHKGFTQIVSIHAASALSGIYNAARLAAREFTQRIEVVDSGQITLGLGFQVLQAARDARQKLPLDSILKEIASIRDRVRVFAMLDTFEFIHRSGRVSWAKARIGSILQIKPVLELKGGEVINKGLIRARGKGIRYLGEILSSLGELEQLAVLHTNAEADGQRFIQAYAPEAIPHPLLVNVTTIIGTHVGPNGLGFAAVVK
jgi:DegV family protein with EDD domain